MVTVAVAAVCWLLTLLAVRQGIHVAAKRRRWRIGPLSKLLPGWKEQACLCCATSYAYTRPHGTPVEMGGVRGVVYPICEPCWTELGTPAARIVYYEELFREWDADPGVHRTIQDLYAVRAAVVAGL